MNKCILFLGLLILHQEVKLANAGDSRRFRKDSGSLESGEQESEGWNSDESKPPRDSDISEETWGKFLKMAKPLLSELRGNLSQQNKGEAEEDSKKRRQSEVESRDSELYRKQMDDIDEKDVRDKLKLLSSEISGEDKFSDSVEDEPLLKRRKSKILESEEDESKETIEKSPLATKSLRGYFLKPLILGIGAKILGGLGLLHKGSHHGHHHRHHHHRTLFADPNAQGNGTAPPNAANPSVPPPPQGESATNKAAPSSPCKTMKDAKVIGKVTDALNSLFKQIMAENNLCPSEDDLIVRLKGVVKGFFGESKSGTNPT